VIRSGNESRSLYRTLSAKLGDFLWAQPGQIRHLGKAQPALEQPSRNFLTAFLTTLLTALLSASLDVLVAPSAKVCRKRQKSSTRSCRAAGSRRGTIKVGYELLVNEMGQEAFDEIGV